MVSSADNRIDELIGRVRHHGAVADFVFIPAYPPHKTPNPIGNYTITVGDSVVRSKRYFIGDRVGSRRKGILQEVELCLRVYAPERTSGSALLRVSSILMDALDAEDSERWIRSYRMSGIGFDTASHTEYRDVTVHLSILLDEEAIA